MQTLRIIVALIIAIGSYMFLSSSHYTTLWWKTDDARASKIYGEIVVLATKHSMYYAAANWFTSNGTGGYTGIQDIDANERRTIFSLWDGPNYTVPSTSYKDQKTITNRFTNEGSGEHSHMVIDWKLGEVFKFYVTKSPSKTTPNATDSKYYFYDKSLHKWRQTVTITSPNDSGTEIGISNFGGLGSFLESFADRDIFIPKIVLYRLWMGNTPATMKPLTQATATHGMCGQFADYYFLAQGNRLAVSWVFHKWRKFGKAVFEKTNEPMTPLTPRPIPTTTIHELEKL